MSLLADTRALLAETMREYGVLPGWRVHEMPPETIAAPCVWVDLPNLHVDDQGRGLKLIRATWTLIAVFDGADPAQVRAFDSLLPRIWDALDNLPMSEMQGAISQPFDIGGPRTRGVALTLDVTYAARTFCAPVTRLDPSHVPEPVP